MVSNHNAHTHDEEIEANNYPVAAQGPHVAEDSVFPAVGSLLGVRSVVYSLVIVGGEI